MAYNFLREARHIRNSFLCMHDTLDGYSSDFHENGDVDGWDIYNNIYLYGCWNGVLFGTSYDRECYIGRSANIPSVEAEDYYVVKIMMKITNNNLDKSVQGLSTGRLRWVSLSDGVWNSNKQVDFDIVADDKWRLYTINMGPFQWWQGDISNLRIYPFIDGWSGDEFAIKYIKISSRDKYACSNTQCSYYLNYKHPCPGGGSRGSCESGLACTTYTTISGINDKFIVNIDGYGNETFELGTNENVTPVEMSKIMENKIASLSIGGYAYVDVEYSENDKLKLYSGTVGSNSSVVVVDSPAARVLGFFDNDGNDISTVESGDDPADGFDYASSRLLTPLEINKLVDGKTDSFAYIHNPHQYNIEGGRRDFNEVGTSRLLSDITSGEYYQSLNNTGRTLLDLSHPINNNGRLKAIYVYGKATSLSKIKILRPKKNGSFTVIYSLDMPVEDVSKLYTAHPINYRVDCNLLVSKGDVIGVYNADLYVGVTLNGRPDAVFSQIEGDVSVGDIIEPDKVYSFGVAGFAIYARGDRLQDSILLDIDLGNRINVEEMNIYGMEQSGEFEFNIASCLDLSWNVNLYNGSHYHSGVRWTDGTPWYETHLNIAYGHNCLNDCIKTADNGRQGDTFTSGPNGIETYGQHSYFYVNGDAEWLYSFDCNGKTEYCWPYVPGSSYGSSRMVGVGGFTRDPISFTLLFPYNFTTRIHKSIIYFKERNNFRSIELSYYLGPYQSTGNAYKDTRFMRIPNYTSIKLDGLEYLPDSDDIANDYLFNNPTNADINFARANRYDPTNWREYRAALVTDWTILEHNFDQVECAGFRIYTDHHNSTKIMEIELYSKIKIDTSLLDNVSLSFSDYGDVWNDVVFEEISDNKISGFMGGAPRYMRLGFSSATVFELNEIECLVGDQVKLQGCAEVVNLEHAPSRKLGDPTAIVLENVYDKPFDLSVDIPAETSESEDIIFWSKLHSQNDIEDPQIGPGCTLYKNADYVICNHNKQCAINVPSYGLNNLIDGKRNYINENTTDWLYNGTLVSGISIDYTNSNYRVSEFTFPGVSSKYWKFCFPDLVPYSAGFIKSPDWHTQYGINLCTFEYDAVNSFSPLFFNVPDTNAGHDMVYRNLDTLLDETTPFMVKFKVRLTEKDSYVFVYIGMCTYKSGSGHPMGVYLVIRPYGSKVGLRVIDSSGNYDETWSSAWDLNVDYYVSLSSDGSGNYNCKIWTDTWEGSVLKFNLSVTSSRHWSSAYWGLTNGFDDGSFTAHLSGVLMDVAFYVKDIICYFDDNRIYQKYIYSESNCGAHSQNGATSSSGINIDPLLSIRPDNNAFGVSFYSGKSLNKMRIIHNDYDISNIDVYTSTDNTNNYTLVGSGIITIENSTFDNYYAIDLVHRHNIEIIRNYGDATNKLDLGITQNVEYSNTNTNNINDVVWGNTSYTDARWVRFNLLCGDGVDRYIRKLGIYPDITQAYCIDGGYNCEWTLLGNILADYYSPINVAYNSVVTGTNNYFRDFYPDNAVDGVSTDYRAQACWGFDDSNGDPYLELDFGRLYDINKVVLYHGYSPDDSDYMNVDYNFQISTTSSGNNFHTVFSITNNSDFVRTHYFTHVLARRARLTITKYNHGRLFIIDPVTNAYDIFLGSFLREIEIYTYADNGYVSSEDWPIVCLNLLDQFQIVNHELVNKDPLDSDTDWDNDETYFKYSDNVFDIPEKVAFTRAGSEVEVYYTNDSSGDARTTFEYIFDENVYFDEGVYNVEWQSYYNQSSSEISLTLEGPYLVELYAESINTTWADESGVINVPMSGFYTVKVVQHETSENHWGGRNIYIYRMAGLTKWVAVKRDTAENYSWDDDPLKYGADYLTLVKIFGDTKYIPTEYGWWWQSIVSEISDDSLIVKTGGRSLKISYPASVDVDVVQFFEGDDFGNDVYFSIKDMLHFWLYIDDVSRLDATVGDITFGIVNDADPVYYTWYIKNLSLNTGWNNLRLKFEDAEYTYPIPDESDDIFGYLNEKLDFRTTGRNFSTFRLRYKGLGQAFNMYIDDLQIKRNVFEDYVKFGNGLCLTGYDYLDIPLSGITLERGAIEFYIKLYTDTYGIDSFGNMHSRSLFTMVNNNNDVVSFGIRSGDWFAPNVGHVRKYLNLFEIDNSFLSSDYVFFINDVVHVAVVWSNNGKYIDNGDTIRLYINGELIARNNVAWSVDDTKAISIRLGGSNTQLALNSDSYGSAIFSNVKIYNYCKTHFTPNEEDINNDKIYTPNEFIQISSDGVNFYGRGSDKLPIVFPQVPAGDSRTIYVRTNKNEKFGRGKTTANLLISWLTSV